jgi:hypothetical protein
MKIEYAEIKASNKSQAKSLVSLGLAMSGFYNTEYKFGEVKRISKTEYVVEVIYKGDKGMMKS